MESVFMISLPVGHRLKWDVRAMVKAFYHISVATAHFRTKLNVVRYSSICVPSYRRWVSAPREKLNKKPSRGRPLCLLHSSPVCDIHP